MTTMSVVIIADSEVLKRFVSIPHTLVFLFFINNYGKIKPQCHKRTINTGLNSFALEAGGLLSIICLFLQFPDAYWKQGLLSNF